MSVYDDKFWVKSYDKHVKTPLQVPRGSLGELFDKAMLEFPGNPACWFMEREITYDELRGMVHRFATYLQINGLEKGDRVAINLPNCPQYMVAHFGTLLAGGAASGCSPLLSDSEIAFQLNDSEAKFVITLDAVYAKTLKNVLNQIPKLKGIITTNVSDYMGLSTIKVILGKLFKKIPKGKVTPYPGKIVKDFKKIMNETSMDVKPVKIDPLKDLALLQYTGGTTGTPKGTELTHHNIKSNIKQVEDWIGLEKGKEVAVSAFPYFHLAGLFFCMNMVNLSGSQVLIANPRDTGHLISEIIDKNPTLVVNVPTLYMMVMKNPKSHEIPITVLNNVKAYISGAAPFPSEPIKEFESRFEAEGKVIEVYGMTESSPLVTSNPFLGKKKIGTVGLPLQDTEVLLVDIDSGKPVELGQPGEILIKGPQVTRGYYNKPEANKKTIDKNGWLHTGDVGVMDEDGFITIVDRTKDMLIVSGFKVYSVHVEEVMTKHPDIELIAIIGLKDPKRPGSEIVKAFIQLKKGIPKTIEIEEGIKRYAAENLSKYENPKEWEFREELPTSLIGKVLKKELRVQN